MPPRPRSRRAVIDAVAEAYGAEYANVHRGLHFLSNLATEKYEEAREIVRRFINAASTDEIVFTRNATEAINLAAASFGGSVIGEGDEIVLSIMEHHSNIVPWNFLREHRGAVIKWAPVADDGTLPDRGIREAARRPAPRWWRSPTCRMCSAPWCR